MMITARETLTHLIVLDVISIIRVHCVRCSYKVSYQ